MIEYALECDDGLTRKVEFTNVILNEELKNIAYKEIITAQDESSPFFLSKLRRYNMYHEALEKHFITNYGKKPTQTDNLAFILLLTYPKKMIEKFKNFTNLKLAFNNITKESDFESNGFHYNNYKNSTCICNEYIQWVRIFRNKYSGISIQVGSICNKRYGLISPDDANFKSDSKLIKEYKERQKEIENKLPIGFYEEQRKTAKEKKIKEKMEKEFNKKIRKQEKLIKKEKIQQQEEYKLMFKEDNYAKKIKIENFYKKCMLCKREGLYNKICKLTICNKCVNNKDKNYINIINEEILKNKREYKEDECINCEIKFTYRYRGIVKGFCKSCEKKYIILKCKLCPNEFMDFINSTDILCNICDTKSKDCIDCENKFISENVNLLRCNLCQYRFIHKIKVKFCQECDDEFEIKENENWKTYCSKCFKDSLCSVKCLICSFTFKKLPCQEWKKTCTDCYYKLKK